MASCNAVRGWAAVTTPHVIGVMWLLPGTGWLRWHGSGEEEMGSALGKFSLVKSHRVSRAMEEGQGDDDPRRWPIIHGGGLLVASHAKA
jgi:hypothetical protein